MTVPDSVLSNLPSLLIIAGIVLSFVPAAWLELPVANRQAGVAVAALGVVLLYAGWFAGWYDRADSESEPSAADSVTQTPARTSGPGEMVYKYVPTGLLTIGMWLLLGRTPRSVSAPSRLHFHGGNCRCSEPVSSSLQCSCSHSPTHAARFSGPSSDAARRGSNPGNAFLAPSQRNGHALVREP